MRSHVVHIVELILNVASPEILQQFCCMRLCLAGSWALHCNNTPPNVTLHNAVRTSKRPHTTQSPTPTPLHTDTKATAPKRARKNGTGFCGMDLHTASHIYKTQSSSQRRWQRTSRGSCLREASACRWRSSACSRQRWQRRPQQVWRMHQTGSLECTLFLWTAMVCSFKANVIVNESCPGHTQ